MGGRFETVLSEAFISPVWRGNPPREKRERAKYNNDNRAKRRREKRKRKKDNQRKKTREKKKTYQEGLILAGCIYEKEVEENHPKKGNKARNAAGKRVNSRKLKKRATGAVSPHHSEWGAGEWSQGKIGVRNRSRRVARCSKGSKVKRNSKVHERSRQVKKLEKPWKEPDLESEKPKKKRKGPAIIS